VKPQHFTIQITVIPTSAVSIPHPDTWYLRFISASKQLFVVSTDLKSESYITEILLLPSNEMLLLVNQSASVPAPLPYYFAPTCIEDGCSLRQANK
jgi:hypothetical protein